GSVGFSRWPCGCAPAPRSSGLGSTSTSSGPYLCATLTEPGSPRKRARSSGSFSRLFAPGTRRRRLDFLGTLYWGSSLIEAELMQYGGPVGPGPAGKTWARDPTEVAAVTAVRATKAPVS